MTAHLGHLLDVLDRADQRAERERLLAAAVAVDTPHTAGALAQAVDEHLAKRAPSVSLEPITSPPAYAFGWDRPITEAQRHRRRNKGWRAWLAKYNIADGSRPSSPAIWASVAMGLMGLGCCCFMAGENVFLGVMAVVMSALLMVLGVDVHVTWCARRANVQDLVVLEDEELHRYLGHSATRAYLQAVLDSNVPLMKGDQEQLTIMHQAIQAAERATRQEAIEAERQAKEQQQIARQRDRLKTLLAQRSAS
jgi:hypothetical protein